MGSVASTNPGLADLLQNLTSASSPLASQLSSPAVQAALENAPPGDIVLLSNEAVQLQEVGALFGDPSQTASTIDPSSILAALFPSSSDSTTAASSTPSSSLTDQVQTLFGTNPTTTSNSLFNVVG